MSVITAAMEERRNHTIKARWGEHVMEPLYDAAVVSPDDLIACRESGLVCVTKDGYERLPVYIKPWVDELVSNGFDVVLSRGSVYHEPSTAP